MERAGRDPVSSEPAAPLAQPCCFPGSDTPLTAPSAPVAAQISLSEHQSPVERIEERQIPAGHGNADEMPQAVEGPAGG